MSVISKNVRYLVNATVLSTTGYFRRQKWTHPVVAANTGILAATTLGATTTTVSTGFTQPDFARTIRLKASSTATQGATVVINGTDIRGNAITENVTMGAAFATPTDSLKAFKTITSVVLPIDVAASNISIGAGAKLGIDRAVLEDSAVYATVDTVEDTARAVISYGATIAGNTVLFATALANTKVFVVGYFANEITSDPNTTA